MNKITAQTILAISMECTRDIHESVQRVKDECDEETFQAYRGYGGQIMGYLFTEIIAPTQSEHLELAPPDFVPMEAIELPRLTLTKETQVKLFGMLDQIYARMNEMTNVIHDAGDKVEAAIYHSRIHQVLGHVAEASACVWAAHIVPD